MKWVRYKSCNDSEMNNKETVVLKWYRMFCEGWMRNGWLYGAKKPQWTADCKWTIKKFKLDKKWGMVDCRYYST